MPRAFVTGITGQDGSYLAEKLAEEGWQVHGLVHAGDSQVAALTARTPQVVLHEGDLTDHAGIAALVDDVAPDEIYNLGGVSSVAVSWQQPLLAAAVNGIGAAGLLDAAWQLQGRVGRPVRVLQASSAEIFGAPEQAPQTEATPLRPLSPYGAAKAFAHQLTAVYRARGLHASTVILYNHESPRRPETFVTRKITRAAAMIAAGKQDTLRLGNLDARRDWGWAPDYVDAMQLAVRHERPADYIIATGTSHSVREFVVAAFERAGVADWAGRVVVDPEFVRPVDAVEQVGDAARARADLGWAPTVEFVDIVARMVDADVDAV
jgi:GDPmannose 4,6-dehydratase